MLKPLLVLLGFALVGIGIYLTFRPRGDMTRGETVGLRFEAPSGVLLIVLGIALALVASGVISVGGGPAALGGKGSAEAAVSTSSAVPAPTTSRNTQPPSAACEGTDRLRITSPVNGTKVGPVPAVSGCAHLNSDESLWLAVELPGTHHIFIQNGSSVMVEQDGTWQDRVHVGAPGEEGISAKIRAIVLPGRAAEAVQEQVDRNNGDGAELEQLPPDIVEQVYIRVSRPSR